MEITHFIFLIHPCCYEKIPPETIHKNNWELFIDREREVKQKWLSDLRQRDKSTLFFQLYGSKPLFETAKEILGEPNACYVSADYPGEGQLAEYYSRLTQCMHEHIKKYNLEFNPATVTSELWGQSFEGCVPGYGGAFSERLKLKQKPKMRFEMTGYDSRFLYGARRWEVIALPGTDIEAWMFECYDGTSVAIFQARLSAQWLDKRPIHLDLDPTQIMVCTKTGFTVWPEHPPAKGDKEVVHPFILTTSDSYWIRAYKMNFDELRDVIKSAIVGNLSTEMEE